MGSVHGLWVATMLVASAPAMAAQLSDLVPAENRAAACWSRVYDAAHLKAHPDQQVQGMDFSIRYSAATGEYAAQYDFTIAATLRDGSVGHNTGPCTNENGKIWCGIECDGGYVMVEPRANGSVLLDLETSGYIWLSGGCGVDDGEGGFALESGKDDKSFLLQAAAPGMCKQKQPN